MRKLLFSHFINGLANGLPPALFVFFVNSILKSPELTGFLLFLYYSYYCIANNHFVIKFGSGICLYLFIINY